MENKPIRVLYLDGLPHAHVDLNDPLNLVHDYLVPAAEIGIYIHGLDGRTPRVLVIGGGGYSLPRFFAAAFPESQIDVLELDPVVTSLARAGLGVPARPPYAIHHGDARQTILDRPPGYDLAVLDAFADVVVPFQLATAELDEEIRRRLKPDGAYVALVHDRADTGRLLPAFAHTMRSVFGSVDILAAGPGVRWDSSRPRTWAVVGTGTGVDPNRLRAVRRPTSAGPFPPLSEVMPEQPRQRLLARAHGTITDDYAPVELLAAPLVR